MKIGVMSDTHGHLTEARKAALRMAEEFFVDAMVHLGDDSTDIDGFLGIANEVIFVPGVFEERYRSPSVSKRIIRDFEGVTFLLTHTPTKNSHDKPDDIDPTEVAQDGEVKVVLYGHSHKYDISEKHGAIYINPGHLNGEMDRGSPASFAIVEINGNKLTAKIILLSGGVIEEKTFFTG